MNERKLTGNRTLSIYLFVIILIFVNIAVFAHKNKPHTVSDSNAVESDVIPNDSTQIVLDSIYAIIQNGLQNLQPLFQRACFDCHTDQTTFPWYYKLPLVKGLIDEDIKEARKHLDMSKGFPFLGHGTPLEDLNAIKEVLEKGEMPPFKYKMLHWNAGFSSEEIDSINVWINNSLKQISENSLTQEESSHEE